MNCAYVTVMTNDKFYPGLCALNYSLKKVQSRYPLVVLVPVTMKQEEKQLIQDLGIQIIETEEMQLGEAITSANPMKRWNMTFFKLKVFGLEQFDKIVFLDADIIVLQNIDELFEQPHMSCVPAGLCAHADWTRLNSGVMVLTPSKEEYQKIMTALPSACQEYIKAGLPFGDQDVINYCYPDWYEQKELVLSEVYNTMASVIRKFTTAYGYRNMRVLHFSEHQKPWQYRGMDLPKVLFACLSRLNFMKIRVIFLYLRYIKRSCPNYRDFP